MSPLTGLLKQEAISYPSALALGHIIAALTGLADRPRYVIVFVKRSTSAISDQFQFPSPEAFERRTTDHLL